MLKIIERVTNVLKMLLTGNGKGRYRFLASPVTGGGVTVGRFQQPLRGFHASQRPDFYRIFHNQGAGALPPQTRFPTAHLLAASPQR